MKTETHYRMLRIAGVLFVIGFMGSLLILTANPISGDGAEGFFGFGDAPVYLDNDPAGQIAGQETPAIQSVCESALGYDAAGWVAGTPPTIVCHNETHTGYVPMPEEIQAQENVTVAQATVSG